MTQEIKKLKNWDKKKDWRTNDLGLFTIGLDAVIHQLGQSRGEELGQTTGPLLRVCRVVKASTLDFL